MIRPIACFATILFSLGMMLGCDDNGGPAPDATVSDAGTGKDALASDQGQPEDDGPTPPDQGPSADGSNPGQPCGFVVGDNLKGTVGDNKDFVIGGVKRTFIVQLVNVPAGYGNKLPVFFGYHGTGSYYNIATKYYTAVTENRPFIYVVPQGLGDITYPWDFTADPSQNKDIKFFDDMLACLKAQFNVDMSHIHAFGFSWGGHWINYLVSHRGSVLAATAQISAGAINPSGTTFESLLAKNDPKPAQMVVWGGTTDVYGGYSFDSVCKSTVASFLKEGYFVLQCVHDKGHAITPPESLNKFMFEFFQDHPKGISPDPYLNWPPSTPFTKGTYLQWPSWCSPAT